jgi:hypothetical protein
MNQQTAGNAGPVTWQQVAVGFWHGRHQRHRNWLVAIVQWADRTRVCVISRDQSEGSPEIIAGRIIGGLLSTDLPVPIDVVHTATDKLAELERAQ